MLEHCECLNRSEENLNTVLTYFVENQNAKRSSLQLDISRNNIHRILRENNYHPY